MPGRGFLLPKIWAARSSATVDESLLLGTVLHMQALAKYPAVVHAAQQMNRAADALVDLCVAIQQIPAPTGQEQARAAWVCDQFKALGLQEIVQDGDLHNVYGRWPGQGVGPGLLISAHTDTVFGAETDLSVTRDVAQGRVYGPGIGDNAMGVAAAIGLIQTLRRLPPPPVDLWFAANSREEGLGDLGGMRGVVDGLDGKVGACIVIEGMGLGRVVHRGLGSRRYRVHVEAPGGHSWSDYGAASAVHVLAQLAADLTHLRPPEEPRTTFNIGRMEGGTSVNTIAQSAWLELDLRSEDTAMLAQMVQETLRIVGNYQTPRWERKGVHVRLEQIGDRPSGGISEGHPLVTAAQESLAAAGYPHAADLRISSTDANVPLSRGIPAVCVGVTEGGSAHRLQEWIGVERLPIGMAHLLLLTWRAADWLREGRPE
jgi:acetylornithine deacetylase/succinyl-diaminopimelate desuccinylase-like protein